MKQIDHDPKEPLHAANFAVGAVQIVVFGVGFALIGYVRANYGHEFGIWLFSLFGW